MNEQDKNLCERANEADEVELLETTLVEELVQAIERLSGELEEAKVWPSVFAAKNTLDAALVMRNDQLVQELAALKKAQVEPVAIALHYPECWDTAAYPTVWDALAEAVSWFKCNNDDCQHPPVVSEDARDAEIQRLRKVIFDAWEDTDWLLIANEVHDMKDAK